MARPRSSLSTVTLAGLLGGIGACSTATAEDRDLIERSDDGEAGQAPAQRRPARSLASDPVRRPDAQCRRHPLASSPLDAQQRATQCSGFSVVHGQPTMS
jgi:hypothetical protein